MSSNNMPTGAPGFMPRRSSYASVVSGAAIGSPHNQYSQIMRSGAFSHLTNPEADLGYDSTYHNLSGHPRHDPRAYDMDFTTNGGTHGRSGSWGRGGQLPSFSSAFGPLVNGHGYGGVGGGHVDHFFVPSYLKESKYVQRLEDAYRAKIAAHKDGHSAHSSQPGSLSTSASSINLHTKMAPSHRGMTYDLIEKAPPVDDETLAPLPSRWNSQDKYGGLEVLSDGQEVKFTGPKSDRDRDLEACAIRADHSMPPQCGIYYFEVTIISRKREESSIGIGFSSKNVPLSRLPGWEPESWAYHGDDGHSFCCNSSGKHYGPPFNAGDIVGCGINFRTNSAFFTKNGDHLGTAFRDIKKEKLYPSVGMKKAGEHIRVNFGQSPFVFDIDGMMSASNNFSYPQPPPAGSSSGNPPLDGTNAPGSPGLRPDTSTSGVTTTELPLLEPRDNREDDSDIRPPLISGPPTPRASESTRPLPSLALVEQRMSQAFQGLGFIPLTLSMDPPTSSTVDHQETGVSRLLAPISALEQRVAQLFRRGHSETPSLLTPWGPSATRTVRLQYDAPPPLTSLSAMEQRLSQMMTRYTSMASPAPPSRPLIPQLLARRDTDMPRRTLSPSLVEPRIPQQLRRRNSDASPPPISSLSITQTMRRTEPFRPPQSNTNANSFLQSLSNLARVDIPRSTRATILLELLQTESLSRILNARERNFLRIAAAIDEYRASLPGESEQVHETLRRRMQESERTLDEIGGRIISDFEDELSHRPIRPVSLAEERAEALARICHELNLRLDSWDGVLANGDNVRVGMAGDGLFVTMSRRLPATGFTESSVRDGSSHSMSLARGLLQGPRDINAMADIKKQQEKKQIRQQIEITSTAHLAPPLSETELIQSLVLQFLTHDGYVETARAFAEEIYDEKKALSLDPNALIQGVDVKEDEDAGHRQRIRIAVLEGDIEKAFKHTHAYYPNVLKDNEHVSFRLKCRKFIEMIRQGAEMQKSSSSNGTKKSNGHNGDWYDDIINHDMDLDDHQSQSNNNWDRMDTEESSENQMEYQRLLQDTLAYGQLLQAEYKDDPRREVSKALEDAFALMAYSDPLSAPEVKHLLDPDGRAAVAEELNSAILLSLGKSSTAALEKLIQQSTVLLEDLGEGGGPGAFVSIDDFVKVKAGNEL